MRTGYAKWERDERPKGEATRAEGQSAQAYQQAQKREGAREASQEQQGCRAASPQGTVAGTEEQKVGKS